jgi:CheY-like chemotaxis protein
MHKRVLVVDDEPDIVEIVTCLLEGEGYETLTARDGLEAVEVAEAEKPDLMLLDVMMPEMNGYQVCRLLRAKPDLRDMPVVMLTAKAQQSDQFWGLDSGATAYLTKPFDNRELLRTVGDILAS